ncbi:proline-rich proteoglycan 2-like [Aquila chrysaetos chrysaetos]|uniref:proline-rich proteoglycan 2-like n=1 Tax=Aquila chrysaetos chrysaetos TaxID=223781 RepID=UPI001B7D4094|nr:proline-rich proteoglycan 2-like [Aquila chrysaetos chrysaetos]
MSTEGAAETEVFPVGAAPAGPDAPPPQYPWEERPPTEAITGRQQGLEAMGGRKAPPCGENQAPLPGERTEPPEPLPEPTPAEPLPAPLPEKIKPSSGSFRRWREVPPQVGSDSSDEGKADDAVRRPLRPAPQVQTEGGQDALQRLQGLLGRLEGAIQNAERAVPLMPPTLGAGDGEEGDTQRGTDW